MKIIVYAICKNEIKNIDAWYESMKEADNIYVLDTGSTDGSYEKLKSLNINVKQKKIKPWRFDIARNESLKIIKESADLYVCTDLDERFENGWRNELENNINKNTTRVSYLYNWSFNENGIPDTTFYINKIHNKNYVWKNAVHEVLDATKEENIQCIDSIVLNHYQDYNKDRSSYLSLLELSVKEDANNDRNMHYLGREYMYNKKYDKCISTLHKHLNLPNSIWKDERAASMRYIARCYKDKRFYEEARLWYNLAISEAPYLREAYVELAFLEYELKNYLLVEELLDSAFLIKGKPKTYINEAFAWDWQIYNLYAINAYYLNKKDIAISYLKRAISLNDNKVLRDNLIFFNKY